MPFSERTKGQLKKGYEYTGKAKHDHSQDGTEDPSNTKRRIIEGMRKRGGARLRAILPISSGSQPVIELPTGEVVKGVACFPSLVPEICINLGSEPGDWVGDPYAGLGATLLAAAKWGRNSIGIELHPSYCEAIQYRLRLQAEGRLK